MTTLASAPISREPEKHGARMVCPFTFSLGLGLTTLTSSHMRRDRPRLLQSYSTRPCSHIAGIESISSHPAKMIMRSGFQMMTMMVSSIPCILLGFDFSSTPTSFTIFLPHLFPSTPQPLVHLGSFKDNWYRGPARAILCACVYLGLV